MDTQLKGQEWIAGDYSIADMALFGWTQDYAKETAVLGPFANIAAWYARLLARPALQRGLAVLADTRKAPSEFDDQSRTVMFGEDAVVARKDDV